MTGNLIWKLIGIKNALIVIGIVCLLTLSYLYMYLDATQRDHIFNPQELEEGGVYINNIVKLK